MEKYNEKILGIQPPDESFEDDSDEAECEGRQFFRKLKHTKFEYEAKFARQ